jgi:hypothetical protein
LLLTGFEFTWAGGNDKGEMRGFFPFTAFEGQNDKGVWRVGRTGNGKGEIRGFFPFTAFKGQNDTDLWGWWVAGLEGGWRLEVFFAEGWDGFAPRFAEVSPGGVVLHDEGDLLNAQPAFDLGFAGDGVLDKLEALEVDQPIDAVSGGKRVRVGGGFVLGDAGS